MSAQIAWRWAIAVCPALTRAVQLHLARRVCARGTHFVAKLGGTCIARTRRRASAPQAVLAGHQYRPIPRLRHRHRAAPVVQHTLGVLATMPNVRRVSVALIRSVARRRGTTSACSTQPDGAQGVAPALGRPPRILPCQRRAEIAARSMRDRAVMRASARRASVAGTRSAAAPHGMTSVSIRQRLSALQNARAHRR